MSDYSDRYRKVSGQFSRRVEAVAADAWDNPAPCEGWVARDVVGHLVEWLPSFFVAPWDIVVPPHPSVSDDPVAAWQVVCAAFQSAFDDPGIAGQERDSRMGRSSFEATFDQIGTTDILLHTWDLARSTGLDETLDPHEVHQVLAGMEPYDEVLRQSGQYGPRVPVPDDADEQTRLLAFVGRRP
jgi:uncharacterized protein (TIGR03086 family)